MRRKITVFTLVGVLALGMLMVPAAANHIRYDVGMIDAEGRAGASWTGCSDDGTSAVSTPGSETRDYPNHWPYFRMIGAVGSNWDGRGGNILLCGRLNTASTGILLGGRPGATLRDGNPFGSNPGNGCLFSDGKGSITFNDQKLWLRNVRSHGDVIGSVLPLMGEVVAAPNAATAGTMTPHHYIYIDLQTAYYGTPCWGHGYRDIDATYRIVSQDPRGLPVLCEDDWDSGCLYGPGPSWWPQL